MKRIATPGLNFCSWLQLPGQPWRLVLTASTRAEAGKMLLAAPVPDGTRTGRRMVLPAGQLPVRRPEGRADR
jgi:hypothetical protein